MENELEKKKLQEQRYQEEVARLEATRKRMLAEANEMISALMESQKRSYSTNPNMKNQKKPKSALGGNHASETRQSNQASQKKGTRLGFWGNLCALFMVHKLGDMVSDSEDTDKKLSDEYHTDLSDDYSANFSDDYGADFSDRFDPIQMDDYIEEEEEF
jgi:hypothetical protein